MHQESAGNLQLSKERRWAPYVLAAGLYAIITALFIYPQIRILTSGFIESPIGGTSDYNLFMWNAWWTKKALVDLGVNPFHTNYLFYPNTTSLALHELTLLNNILTIPFQMLLTRPAGIILGYNVTIFLSFVITGLGMFALIKYLTGNSSVAFFGGVAFAFCPYRTMHIAHTDMLSMGWIPLYVLFLLKVLREPKLRYAIYGALSFAAASFTCTTYAYFLLLLTGYVLLYALIFERTNLLRRPTLLPVAVLAFLMGVVLLPRVVAMAGSGATGGQPEWTLDMLSANLVGFILPSGKHVLYRFIYHVLPKFNYYISGVPGHATFLTFTILALAVFAALKVPLRRIGFWLLLFLVFFILSLGPSLHVWKWTTAIPLPYTLLYKYLPFFNVMRTPYRFVVLAEMGSIAVACYGLAHLLESLQNRPLLKMNRLMKFGLAGGFVFLLLLELWNIPFAERIPPVPKIYRDIGAEKGRFAVLDLPAASYSALTTSMYYQTIHEKPIPGGMLSRFDPQLNSFRKGLLPASSDPTGLTEAEASRLKELKIKYVVYHHWKDDGTDDIVAVVKLY
jgi:hypothetical protein